MTITKVASKTPMGNIIFFASRNSPWTMVIGATLSWLPPKMILRMTEDRHHRLNRA